MEAIINNKKKSDIQITMVYKYAHVNHRSQKGRSEAISKIRTLGLYLFTTAVYLNPVGKHPSNRGKRKNLLILKLDGRTNA